MEDRDILFGLRVLVWALDLDSTIITIKKETGLYTDTGKILMRFMAEITYKKSIYSTSMVDDKKRLFIDVSMILMNLKQKEKL